VTLRPPCHEALTTCYDMDRIACPKRVSLTELMALLKDLPRLQLVSGLTTDTADAVRDADIVTFCRALPLLKMIKVAAR
jgi:hypothetical protein